MKPKKKIIKPPKFDENSSWWFSTLLFLLAASVKQDPTLPKLVGPSVARYRNYAVCVSHNNHVPVWGARLRVISASERGSGTRWMLVPMPLTGAMLFSTSGATSARVAHKDHRKNASLPPLTALRMLFVTMLSNRCSRALASFTTCSSA